MPAIKSKVLRTFIVSWALFGSTAFAVEAACGHEGRLVDAGGYQVPPMAVFQEPKQYGRAIAVCRENGRQNVVLDIGGLNIIYYWDSTAIPEEIFLRKPLPANVRAQYGDTMRSRAAQTVYGAINSGRIKDAVVLKFLNQISTDILDSYYPVDTQADGPYCKDAAAYVAYNNPGFARLCAPAYQEESPHTMIHEFVHIIQFKRGVRVMGHKEECMADLVSVMATAVAAKMESIPKHWAIAGRYLPKPKCKSENLRFQAFLKTLE